MLFSVVPPGNGSIGRRRLLQILALVIALVVGAIAIVTWWFARDAAMQRRLEALDRTLALQSRWTRARTERVQLAAQVLAADVARPLSAPPAAPGPDTGAADAERGRLASRVTELGLDLLGVFQEGGELMVGPSAGSPAGRDDSEGPELAAAVRGLGGTVFAAPQEPAAGLLVASGSLYAMASSPPTEAPVRPALVVVQRLDRPLVRELDQAVDSEIAYLLDTPAGPALGATTLDPELGRELVLAVRARGAWDDLRKEGQSLRLELGGRAWETLLAPLPGWDRAPAAVAVALAPVRSERGLGSLLLVEVLIGVLGAVLLAALLWRELDRLPGAAPAGSVEGLADALRRARGGGVWAPPESTLAGAAETAQEIGQLLEERRALREELDGQLGRFEELATEVPLHHQVSRLALLGIDLRMLAKGDTVKQPDIALARTRRDVDAVRNAIAARSGVVESMLGHRLLATFGGDQAVLAAVRAAAAIAQRLGQPESAFDESRPAVMALAEGMVTVASAPADESAARAVLGRPVQQLDDLLREAMPGDLLVTAGALEEVGDALEGAGVRVREHKGLLTAQRVFAVDLEGAAALLGDA